MLRRMLSSFLVLVTFLLLTADQAHARRGRGGGGGNSSSSGGMLEIAPSSDGGSANIRALEVYYNYNRANDQKVAFTDKARVFLAVRDQQILSTQGSLVAEVRIADLSNYGHPQVRYFPVSLDSAPDGNYTYGSFDVTSESEKQPLLQPAKVYRMFVTLHRKGEKQGPETALGRIASPYYVATAGDSRVDRARQQIVMRTFREFYYRKQGWNSGENYSMDCHAYYMWATGFCTVGAQNERTQLERLFGSDVPYNSGSQIPQLGTAGPIHGDYVRKPGHSFMLLAYDPQLRHVWTMEGNFNSTVEVAIRSVSSDWTVGHLRDEHIRKGMFPRLRGLVQGKMAGR
ncbi:MAG: hypothetical protein K8T91_12260 [Planctomycetes bacterium]|nr:hypothetical protein [Planctomycetota bacterium]